MEILIRAIEIFAFVTGILYIVLEIGQKNLMWAVGILTGAACACSFGMQRLYASMGLNVYYVIVSVWGLYEWRRDSRRLKESTGAAGIHLTKLPKRTVWISLCVFVAGTAGLICVLHFLGDSETALDAVVAMMSAIGTWWLAKSYPQQWLIWIAADLLSTLLCLIAGMYWMSVLYLAYTGSAVYGYFHWKTRGQYI